MKNPNSIFLSMTKGVNTSTYMCMMNILYVCNLKGLILAAGEGSRQRPFTFKSSVIKPSSIALCIACAIQSLFSWNKCVSLTSPLHHLSEIPDNDAHIADIKSPSEHCIVGLPGVVYLVDDIVREGIRQYVEKFLENRSDEC